MTDTPWSVSMLAVCATHWMMRLDAGNCFSVIGQAHAFAVVWSTLTGHNPGFPGALDQDELLARPVLAAAARGTEIRCLEAPQLFLPRANSCQWPRASLGQVVASVMARPCGWSLMAPSIGPSRYCKISVQQARHGFSGPRARNRNKFWTHVIKFICHRTQGSLL